jgi:NAD(P)-dependent dehydrogenase (short-subunit alcohol dehydrogenase family)
MSTLEGRIALVAGATRGAGRGIACMLGEAGATVYCSGRSTREHPASGAHRPETIEETAEMVTARGGRGIAVRTDHSEPEQVRALIERIRSEQGRLDILVNDIWGGDKLTEFGTPFWKHSLENGLLMLERAIHTHIITSHYAAPLMIERKSGLIVEITDGNYFGYRGNLFYDLVKTSVIRLAFSQSQELKKHGITALALTPGFLRSEEMLENFGVAEENWQDGAKKDPHFIASETPYFVGRAVAALAADPGVAQKNGRVFSSWDLSDEYGFTDIDGRRPHWGRYFAETFGTPIKRCDDTFYEYWFDEKMEELIEGAFGGDLTAPTPE